MALQSLEKQVFQAGWAFNELESPAPDRGSSSWAAPKPFTRNLIKSTMAKSVQFCPAAVDFDARYYVIHAPFDLNLTCSVDGAGNAALKFLEPPHASHATKDLDLGEKIRVLPPSAWRHPQRPLIQIQTPYVFLADQEVFVNLYPAFMHYYHKPLPGVVLNTRYPADIWPRNLAWTLEWHDLLAPCIIRSTEPLFYVHFESTDPSRRIRLLQSELTPEVKRYIELVNQHPALIQQTLALYASLKTARPAQLLAIKD